jgi:hypothetical protein
MPSNDATDLAARLERIKKLAAELARRLTDSQRAKALAKRIERAAMEAIEKRRPPIE